MFIYSFMCFHKPVTATLLGGLLLQVLNAFSLFFFDVVLSKCLFEQCYCDVETHKQSARAHMSDICICVVQMDIVYRVSLCAVFVFEERQYIECDW